MVDQAERTSTTSANLTDTAGGVTVAVQCALVGSVLVGCGESIAAAVMMSEQFDHGDWPLGLIAAAAGKAVVTHTLVAVPLVALPVLAVRRIRAVRRALSAWVVAAAVYVLLVSLLIVPYDIRIATSWNASKARIAAVMCGVIGLSAVALAHRYLGRRIDDRRMARLLCRPSIPALCILLGTGTAFVCSPLFDPAGYRVPTASPVDVHHERPHVLWIVMDTARADRLGCYGHARPTSPFFDSWSEQAVVYDRVVANGRWTVPSHASMFTGASVRRHGADVNEILLDDGFDTVAELLTRHGYATASFSNNPFISRTTNFAQGFEAVHVMYYLRRLGKFSMDALIEANGLSPFLPWLDADFGAAVTNEMVGDWLDANATGGAPLFLFVNYMEAHLPYMAPSSYRRMFMSEEQVRRSYQLRRHAYGNVVHLMDTRFNVEDRDFIDRADLEVLELQYEASIRYVDERVRELIGMFEQRGLLDDTLVIITSDHGEHLNTHGMWAHRFLLYNDLVHVALSVREPGRHTGTRIDAPVSLSDLYTTVLTAALGPGDYASPWESRDVLRLARLNGGGGGGIADAPVNATSDDVAKRGNDAGDETAAGGDNGAPQPDPGGGNEPRIVIAETRGAEEDLVERIRKSSDPAVHHLATSQIAATDGHFKYIASGDGMRELFDLDADPEELHNVVEQYPDEAQRLANYIDAWCEAVPYLPLDKAKKQGEMDPEFSKALRSLGYTGD